VIADVDNAVEGESFGIVEAEGKKQCVTIYDFVNNKVTLTATTIPFKKGEIEEIDAAGRPKKD